MQTVLPEGFKPRVPVVGTLKIGDVEQGAGGKAKPKKLDYMRLCTASATASGVYPDHPKYADYNKSHAREITVELISDDPAVNLDIAYVMAGRGTVLCRGNGVTAERRLDPRGTVNADVPFQPLPEGTCGEKCPFFRNKACKLASTLRFRIPGDTPLGTVWQFRTTAWNSAQDLMGAQDAIRAMTGGILARIPLTLFMEEQKRDALTSNGRTRTQFWTLGLSFKGTEEDLIAAVLRAKKIKEDLAALSLPSVEEQLKAQGSDLLRQDLSEEEALSIAAEFYPSLPTTLPEGTASGEATTVEGGEKGENPPAEAPAGPVEGSPTEKAPAAPAKASDAPRGVQPSQKRMVIQYANRFPSMDAKRLEAVLESWTDAQARTFIKDMLADTEGAFRKLKIIE